MQQAHLIGASMLALGTFAHAAVGQAQGHCGATTYELAPGDEVAIDVGRTASEWRPITHVPLAAHGEASTGVEVPPWAEPHDIPTSVIDVDQGFMLESHDFEVVGSVGRSDADSRDGITLEGRVRDGVECYTLTTPDGDLWSLVSDNIEFDAGNYVKISGSRVEMSICQQGIGTMDVEEIENVPAP